MRLYRLAPFLFLLPVGCEFFQRLVSAPPEVVEPIGDAIGDVAVQPTNPVALWKLIVAVAGLIAFGFGTKKVSAAITAKPAVKKTAKAKE